MLTPRMIEAFRAVMLTGSVSEAANFMHISQPAISRLIKDMEAEIGFELFDRQHGRVYANEDALILFEEVDYFFSGMDRIKKSADNIRNHKAGLLRIACMPAVGLSVMPKAIALFKQRFPGISISLQVVRSPTVVQFLSSLHCDIGFVEIGLSSATTQQWKTYRLKSVCIFPAHHALAKKKRIQPQDLADTHFINLGQSSKIRLKTDAVFSEAGVGRTILTEAPLTSVVCTLVREGCGVAIIDPMTAAHYASQGITSRPFTPTIPFEFKALSAPRASRQKLIQAFFDIFDTTIAKDDLV